MQISHAFQHLNWRSVFRRKAGILLLVLLVPNVVLLAGNVQLFPPIGWVDPGIYTGYFWDLPGRIARFGANYFSMRLPFTLVGYIINSVLAPVLAAKLVALAFNTIAIFSIFQLISRRMSVAVGVATAWAITLNPIWIATISRTYVDGPAMAYAFAALALILTARPENNNRIRLGFGGALGAASIYTHPIMILPLGVIVAIDALMRRQNMKSFFQELTWIACGAVLLTIFLGLASLLLGGKFLFILSDPWAFTRTFKGFGGNYRYALSSWVPGAFRLLPVSALLLFSLVLVPLRAAKQNLISNFAIIGLASTGSIIAFLVFLDYGIGGATLQSSFYSSYTLTGLVFLVAAAGYQSFGNTEPQIGKLAVGGGVLALSTILLFSVADKIWSWSDAHTGLLWVLLTTSFAIAIFMLVHDLLLEPATTHETSPRGGAIRKVGFLLLSTTIVLCGIVNRDTRRIFITHSGINYESSFRSTVAVDKLVRKYLVKDEKLFFWYDRDELTTIDKVYGSYAVYQLRFKDNYFYLNYWDSLTAIWLWDRSSLGWTLPELQPDEQDKLVRRPTQSLIVTLCIEIAKCEAAQPALGKLNYLVTEVERQKIDTEGYTPFWVIIYKADPIAESAQNPG